MLSSTRQNTVTSTHHHADEVAAVWSIIVSVVHTYIDYCTSLTAMSQIWHRIRRRRRRRQQLCFVVVVLSTLFTVSSSMLLVLGQEEQRQSFPTTQEEEQHQQQHQSVPATHEERQHPQHGVPTSLDDIDYFDLDEPPAGEVVQQDDEPTNGNDEVNVAKPEELVESDGVDSKGISKDPEEENRVNESVQQSSEPIDNNRELEDEEQRRVGTDAAEYDNAAADATDIEGDTLPLDASSAPEHPVENEYDEQQNDEPMVETGLRQPDTGEPNFTKETIPQPPNKQHFDEPVVDFAATTAVVVDGDRERSLEEQPPVEEPDVTNYEERTYEPINTDTIPQPPNSEQYEEPVVDAAATAASDSAVVDDDTERPLNDQPPVEVPGVTNIDERRTTSVDADAIPQPPNSEQYEEPVVDAAVATTTDAVVADATEERNSDTNEDKPPVEEPCITMVTKNEDASTAPEPPTPLQPHPINKRVKESRTAADAPSPDEDHRKEPVVVEDSATVDDGINVEGQVIRSDPETKPSDEISATPTALDSTDKKRALYPAEDVLTDESKTSTTAHGTKSVDVEPSPEESTEPARESPTRYQDPESEKTEKAPKKGSLAEFFQKANTNEPKKRSATEKAQRGAGDAIKTVPQDKPASDMKQKSLLTRNAMTDILGDQQDKPYCGVWGDYSFGRRRPADLSILYQLFGDEVVLGDDGNGSGQDPKVGMSDAAFENLSLEDKVDTEPQKAQAIKQSEITVEDSAEPKSANNEFVAGLDDIDKLFEGIDPPDELDVGADGTSIQEVLMGSATRVLIKRVSVVAGFVKNNVLRAKDSLVSRVRNAASKLKPLEKLRNEIGEFAPFQHLRDADGEFSPLQRFRDEHGKLMLPSKDQLVTAAKWVQAASIKLYHDTERLLDKMFEGGEIDDVDFSFLPESGSGNREKPTLDDGRATLLQRQQVRRPDTPDR
jgi:hypothetical protein